MSLTVKEKANVRLVFFGAAGVGKTALVHRFLHDQFESKYKRTVEELHILEYEVGSMKIKIEVMDTSGSYSFPAMRKLCIRNGDAFALVYSLNDPDSFEEVKRLRDEILELKDGKDTPIVVVGNKADAADGAQSMSEDVMSTVELDWNNIYLETSAKTNKQVVALFKELLQQVNLPSRLSPALRRRRETIPKEQDSRPPMKKTNSCTVS
ncbi:ras-related protein Rap-2c-like [Protopterus annectens]|uniref:ras-related protein Rap-2c-like n=1 Tax=Protopterus annectens TaxID=7888 RepID=UPI001CFAD5B4|nr:ras-related protein Rap-2c-like [Protopterus annectens]